MTVLEQAVADLSLLSQQLDCIHVLLTKGNYRACMLCTFKQLVCKQCGFPAIKTGNTVECDWCV